MVTANLPTGTITFLFTDIEGSTQLWETAPEEASRALARHDQLVERIVADNGGFLHRARGEGDSQFVVFPRAMDAVAAAVLIQKQFFAEPWETPRPLKIRMALHTGTADLRLGDYYGSEVNRTARLRSIGHGGQILLSGATWSLVQGALPDGVAAQDEGEHRLKDIARPEHVYQLIITNLPNKFPPLKSLNAVLTNIPAQATPFVGRQEEVSNIQAMLAQEEIRLVTLIGPGGTGKTRLALEVAAQQITNFPDGAYFVALAPLSAAGQIIQAIIEAASIGIASGDDLQAQLLRYLRRKKMLLVLDNFEHLLDGARLLNEILSAAPGISILATSREKLNLSGESVMIIGGLEVDEWHTPQEVLAHSAGQLFVQAAQRVQPAFQLHTADVPHVAHICKLVQGLPLAILLAASWADMLSPAEIAAEIANNLDFLETELRDIPERQRSIRAVFEGSWEKLANTERELYKRLSVFRGGFTREAGEKVAGSELRSLARLVNKSFLLRDPETSRYTIHELLRQYAAERLEARPESAAAAKDEHAAYFTAFMDKMWEPLRTHRQREILEKIEADIDNVRVAWRHLAIYGKAKEMGKMVEPLWYFYEIHCWYHAGLDLLSETQVILQDTTYDEEGVVIAAQIKAIRGLFTTLLGAPMQGRELVEESVVTLKSLDRRNERLLPLVCMGITNLFLNRGAAALQVAQEMMAIATELENDWWMASSLNGLGSSSMTARAFEDARQYAEKAARTWEQIGDSWGAIWPETVLAGLLVMDGDYEEARAHHQFALETALSINFRRGLHYTDNSLGNLSFWLGEYREAEDYYLQSLGISDETGQVGEILATLFDISRVCTATDRADIALALVAIILHHPAGNQHALFRQATIKEDAEALRMALEGTLAPESYASAWERGVERDLQNTVDEVLAAGFRQSEEMTPTN